MTDRRELGQVGSSCCCCWRAHCFELTSELSSPSGEDEMHFFLKRQKIGIEMTIEQQVYNIYPLKCGSLNFDVLLTG